MAPKGSINVELVEEFIDCTIRVQVASGRVQGTLHGVSRQDQGLVLIYGVSGTAQFEQVEENQILSLEGESVDGFVSLYPLEDDEVAEAVDDENPFAGVPTAEEKAAEVVVDEDPEEVTDGEVDEATPPVPDGADAAADGDADAASDAPAEGESEDAGAEAAEEETRAAFDSSLEDEGTSPQVAAAARRRKRK